MNYHPLVLTFIDDFCMNNLLNGGAKCSFFISLIPSTCISQYSTVERRLPHSFIHSFIYSLIYLCRLMDFYFTHCSLIHYYYHLFSPQYQPLFCWQKLLQGGICVLFTTVHPHFGTSLLCDANLCSRFILFQVFKNNFVEIYQ